MVKKIASHWILLGTGLGLLFWILDSAIYAVLFQESTFSEQLFTPSGMEIYFRLVVGGLLIALVRLKTEITKHKWLERALRTSEASKGVILETARDAFIQLDVRGLIVYWNPQAEIIFGWPKCEVIGKPLTETIIPSRYYEAHKRGLEHFLATGEGPIINKRIELNALHQEGHEFPIELTVWPVRLGETYQFNAFVHDITERKLAEEKIRHEKDFSENLINSSVDGILAFDRECRYTIWNQGMERISGVGKEKVLGKCAFEVFPFLKETGEDAFFYAALEGKNVISEDRPYKVPATGKEGYFSGHYSPLYGNGGKVVGGLAIIREITDRKLAEKSIRYMAYYDRLTGLPNRAHLIEHLERTILLEQDKSKRIAFFLISLIRLKDVNDTLGLDYADFLLQSVGQHLLEMFGPTNMVARLGGDEFGLILAVTGVEEITLTANKILKLFGEPLKIEGLSLYIEASIGIAISPDHGTSASPLFQKADVALNEAKQSGSGFNVYSPSKDRHSPQRLSLMGELHHAINNNQLLLHYQPKINLQTGNIAGVEALVRWQHPKRGMVSPDQFILPAEQTGLIKPLTRWVLNEALQQCHQWEQSGKKIVVAVNLAIRNIQDPQLPDQIEELLQKFDLSPSSLEVEVTEGTIMTDEIRAKEVLNKLGKMGISISIDDFGKGHSSLSYLRKLSARTIKIDNSFVVNMVVNNDDEAIVRSTINLGHNLGLKVTAEGVEDREVLDRLVGLGCDEAQGYYIARPFCPSELDNRLNEMTNRGGWTLVS
ncbi:MAG: EAL domain-containing protein [Nitrospiria bacterium]